MNSSMNTSDSGDKSEFADNLNIFRQIEFFSGMPIEVVKLFAFLCQRQIYKPGDHIFQQDDDDRCSYYILSGKARLVFETKGREHVIREYGEETYFGVLSLMTPIVKSFSLVAAEETTCIVMTRKAFSKVVDQFPDIPLIISKSIGKRVVQAERKCIAEFEATGQENLKALMGISLI